jgi:hypothetical protein
VEGSSKAGGTGGGELVLRRYLVGQGCCGAASTAWQLAVEGTADLGAPLVPWGAVALPLQVAREGALASLLPKLVTMRLQAMLNDSVQGTACNRYSSVGGYDIAGDYEGQAFCFLPLPTYTGLPAHINATFELSSNRRSVGVILMQACATAHNSGCNAIPNCPIDLVPLQLQ